MIDAPRTFLNGFQHAFERQDNIAGNQFYVSKYQYDTDNGRNYAYHQGQKIHSGQMGSCVQGLLTDGSVEGIDIGIHGIGEGCHIAVGQGIGILGLVAGAGTDQAHQCVPERIIVGKKGFIPGTVFGAHIGFIFRKHVIQKRLVCLDLPDQNNHGIVIRCNDMAQGHFVNIHGRLADFGQPAFSFHIIIGDIGGAGIYIADIDNGKNI